MVETRRRFGAPQCRVCNHKDVDEINERLMSGQESVRSLSIQYGISHTVMHRHHNTHLLSAEYEQGAVTIGWHDVTAIPLAMKERREMQDGIIARIISRLEAVKGETVWKGFQGKLLIDLWKLQMQDEERILRVAGVLKEGVGETQLPAAEYYRQLQTKMEQTIKDFSNGDWDKEADLRLSLANALDPNTELPVGRGPIDYATYLDDDEDELP